MSQEDVWGNKIEIVIRKMERTHDMIYCLLLYCFADSNAFLCFVDMREDQKFFERNVDNSRSWLLLWIFAFFGFGKNHDTSSAVSQYKQQASELGALDKEKDK